jgi:hypothetical protein
MILQERLFLYPFVRCHLHILEHKLVITYSQGFATGNGHVLEKDFPGSDIGKLLQVRIVSHIWIEIGKYSRTLIICWKFGIVDTKVFDNDSFWHMAGIAKIMLT